MLAEFAVVGQGPDVRALMALSAVAATGVTKRVPGSSAMATVSVINAVPPTTAIAMAPDMS
jgi:hypothetical protein